MTHVTYITTPGGEELAVLPRAEYEALLRARDELAGEVAEARAAFAAADSGEDDGLTADEVEALAAAVSPLAFWLQKRGVTQAELAARADLSQPFVSKIVRREATGSIETLRRIAGVLGLTVDDLTD